MPSAKRRISKALHAEFQEFAEEWLQPGGVLYIAEMCVFFRQHFPHYLLNENLSDLMITDQLLKYNDIKFQAETTYVGMLVGVQVNRMQAFMAYKRAQQEEEEKIAKQQEKHKEAMKERDRELYSCRDDGDEEKVAGIQSQLEQSQDHLSKIFDDDEHSFNSAGFQLGETRNHAGNNPALDAPQTPDQIGISAHSNRSPTNVMDLMLLDVPLVAETTKATKKKKKKKITKKVTAGKNTTTKKKKKAVGTAGAEDVKIPKKKITKKKKKVAAAVDNSILAVNVTVKTKKKKKVTKKVKDNAVVATATTVGSSTKKKKVTKKKKKGAATGVADNTVTSVKPKKKKKKAIVDSSAAVTKTKAKKGTTKKKVTKKKKVVQ